MNKTIIPYIFLGGKTEEAIAFYREVLGAEPGMVLHYNQSPVHVPEQKVSPEYQNKVMHASFKIGDTEIFASDGSDPKDATTGFMLVYPIDSPSEGDRVFAALAEGGQIIMPMAETFFSPYYGMVIDRFNIGWMLMIPDGQPA